MRSRTISTALATATLVGAPGVAQASSPIRYAYVTTGSPRSLPAPTVGPSVPVIYGILVLRRTVPARTPVRFVFSRLRGRDGMRHRAHLAVSMPRLERGDRALVVSLPASAYRAHGGAWVLSIHVGDSHRGFLFRGAPLTRIEVRLFAALRERAGHGRTTVQIAPGGGVDEVWAALALGEEPPGLAVAVNRAYADRDTNLAEGDEVAFIPPVSGGEAALARVEITDRPLDVATVIASVADDEAGAVASFVGVVRSTGRFGPGVTHLHYEVYEEMCRSEIERACARATAENDLRSIAVSHRSGLCGLGEPTVAIAVSAPHRDAAFAACRFLIEELKRSAPIWKKEQYVDGAEWVGQGS